MAKIEKVSAGSIVFYNVSGPLWSGKAANVVVRYGRTPISLGQTEWTISAPGLLLGQLNTELQAKKGMQLVSGNFSLSVFRTLQADNVEVTFDSTLAQQFYPIPGTVEGLVEINLQHLQVDASSSVQITALNGNAVLKEASVNFGVPVELGTYGAKLTLTDTNNVQAALSDIDGTVTISGSAVFAQEAQEAILDINIKPKVNANAAISSTLESFFKKNSDGSYKVTYTQKI